MVFRTDLVDYRQQLVQDLAVELQMGGERIGPQVCLHLPVLEKQVRYAHALGISQRTEHEIPLDCPLLERAQITTWRRIRGESDKI